MKKLFLIAFLAILALSSCTFGGQVALRKVSIEITGSGEFWANILTDTIGQSVTTTTPTILDYDSYKNSAVCVDIAVISGTAEVKISVNDMLTKQVITNEPYAIEKIRVPFPYPHYGW